MGDRHDRTVRGKPGRDHPLHGERRQLTALFCDLVGFTGLSQSLDPEDLNDLIDTFEQECRASIRRFGGYLDGLHGDCALAFFGFPATHGDEAERAIRTALAVGDGLARLAPPNAPGIRVHTGIATGTAAVHVVRGEPRFAGEVINLAARLQTLAGPGETLVCTATRAQAAGAFDFADHGLHRLKGFPQPVPVWRLRAPSDEAGHPGQMPIPLEPPFVGRGPEMTMLLDRWRRCGTGGGMAVIVLGEPGIGKSRLVREFADRLGPVVPVVRLGCDPQHAHTSLHPLIGYLREAAGIAADNPPEETLRRLRALPGVGNGTDGADGEAWLPRLLGLDAPPAGRDPREIRQRTIDRLIRHFAERAAVQPLVLIVEDAHWIDPTSAEVMLGLVARLPTAPILMILTARSAQPLQKFLPLAETVTLSRLTREETSTMVARMVGEGAVAPGLLERIVARTEGVPLFVKELTLAVFAPPREDGSGPLGDPTAPPGLPATVQASVLIRLDQLAPVKRVAQIASVLGREFDLETLGCLLGEAPSALRRALRILARAGLITPLAAPDRYAFHHSIVRDGAYGSLLLRDRRELHRRAAEFLSRQDRPGAGLDPEIIAHHYAGAGDIDNAVAYRTIAAKRLLQRAAHLEVIGHASEALRLLSGLPEDNARRDRELTLQLMGGAALWAVEGFSSAPAEAAFTRARALAAHLGEPVRMFVALRGLFGCYYGRGELRRAVAQAGEITALADRIGERGDKCVARLLTGQIALWQGRLLEARAHLEAALALYDEGDQRARMLSSQIDPAVNARIHLGWTLWTLGLPDSGLASAEQALASARRIGQPFGLAMALFWLAVVHLWRGERRQSAAHRVELRQVTREYGIAYLAACATVLEGEDLIAAGHLDRGVALVQSGLAEFRGQSGGLGWPWAMSIIAEGYRREGLHEQALRAVGQGLAAMRRNDERHWEAELHRLRGAILAERPGGDAASSRAFSRAIRVARAQHAVALELRAALDLGRLKARKGLDREARRIVGAVRGRFGEGAATADLVAADRFLGGAAPQGGGSHDLPADHHRERHLREPGAAVVGRRQDGGL